MNRDLFLAILSLDSYNRGYDANVGGLGGLGAKIGNATFKNQSNILHNSTEVSTGFYAGVYDVSQVSGFLLDEEVISYRGTDNLNPLAMDSDIWNGWIVGAGLPVRVAYDRSYDCSLLRPLTRSRPTPPSRSKSGYQPVDGPVRKAAFRPRLLCELCLEINACLAAEAGRGD